ncbi:MAG: potassium transporter Kup [Rhodospirillales bacterium]|nr:potassium transporter Kup [Rhodospirillales bacterium]
MQNGHSSSIAANGLAKPRAGLKQLLPLAIGAIGVVYGDIGTSPLYTIRLCFSGERLAITPANVLGILSLIFWSVMVVVTIKYATIIMRADNQGQGGILALMALALQRVSAKRQRAVVLALCIVGTALFYGDGMITPAISVLSAVEGLKIATPLFEPYVLPITAAIVIGLFAVQRRGTGSMGALFGPIVCVWFVVLTILGVVQIVREPSVLLALSPHYAIAFWIASPTIAFIVMGAVFLAVTGSETLYADMGHFGRPPIRLSWLFLVLPALVINYFGQGGLLLRDPSAIENPFFRLVPEWGLYPLVVIATMATIIASQAVISGAFSMTRQAVQLGLLPRLEIRHTSESEIGQIYIPQVNWLLLVCILALIFGFKSSDKLANAYGIAVSGTMLIDTVMAFLVARSHWLWSLPKAAIVFGGFLIVDVMFVSTNMLKFVGGGWFPLLIGAVVFWVLMTWHQGRKILVTQLRDIAVPLDGFLARVNDKHPVRVPGTAVFLTADANNVPFCLLHNLKHNKVLHQRVILLSVTTESVPVVPDRDRTSIDDLGKGFYRMIARYGFAESPNVPRVLAAAAERMGFAFNMMDISFFLGREKLVASKRPHMSGLREWLFIWLQRNAVSATDFFRIPSNRVVELGAQVEV